MSKLELEVIITKVEIEIHFLQILTMSIVVSSGSGGNMIIFIQIENFHQLPFTNSSQFLLLFSLLL